MIGAALGAGILLLAATARPVPFQNSLGAETPIRIAELLDQIVQEKFQEEAGVFGLSRLPFMDGHTRVYGLNAERKDVDPRLVKANAFNVPYHIRFLRLAHVPGKYVQSLPARMSAKETSKYLPTLVTIGTFDRGRWNAGGVPPGFELSAKDDPLLRLAVKQLPRLKKGLGATAELESWYVSMRPVRALKPSCVGCHQGAKRGDTLGAMLYFIAASSPNESKGSSESAP
jgi:hypothetical protein